MKLTIHIDGGSRGNPGPAAAGVVVQDEQGVTLLEAGYYLGRMTNNAAEYSALLRALDHARDYRTDELTILSDSELLVRQINGQYRVRNPGLAPLFAVARERLAVVKQWQVRHVPRELNWQADRLANEAMDAGRDVVHVDVRPRVGARRRQEAAKASTQEGAAASDQRAHVENESIADATIAGASPRGTRAAEQPPASRRIAVAKCVRGANGDVCPASCHDGTELVFRDVVPAGVCLAVAADLIRAVNQVLAGAKPRDVQCTRVGCGAVFRVTTR